MKMIFPFLSLILVSCSGYRNRFDSCACAGIPRMSVSELESIIVEEEEGPDSLFAPRPPRYGTGDSCCSTPRRVWIEPRTTRCGRLICGHYAYLPGEEN